MKFKLVPQLRQNTILSPNMQQSIEVLMLPLAELDLAINQELQDNPLLEIDETKTTSDQSILDEFINLNLTKNLDSTQSFSNGYDGFSDDEDREEMPVAEQPVLEEYLLQQLRLETNDPFELKIGELIIGNLNEDGYFTATCEYIAKMLQIEDTTPVEMVLHIIQNFEPLGIASRNLTECLLTQVHYKFNGSGVLLSRVINLHLEDIGKKRYTAISQALKISLDQVKTLAKEIAALEPKPARKYRPNVANIYIKPDITIYREEQSNTYKARINQDNIPQLRISQLYKKILKEPNCTDEEMNFIREKIKSGLFFIRSIEQRHETIRQVAEFILEHQKDFFASDNGSLKPLSLKDIAQSINRNESTVCRAINNKYIDTPQGLFPVKYFFSQGVSYKSNDESVASRSIKEEIEQLVRNEDKSAPLSDQDIQNQLATHGINVARRTITKYRKTLAILPSHLRKI